MVARIYSINISQKDNYVSFDDSDSMTDYFHGYSLGVNRTAEWIKKHGGRSIGVNVTNNDITTPALRRIQLIAKTAGYNIEDKTHMHTYYDWQNKPYEVKVLQWLLTANSERLKIIEAEDLEEQRKIKEAEEYAKTPQCRIQRLKCAINQAQSVTAVFGAGGLHMITAEERAKEVAELQKQLAEVEQELKQVA